MGGVLAFDLAPGLCGYCAGDGAVAPTASAWRFPDYGSDYGALAVSAKHQFKALMDQHQPELVTYEAPILLSRDALDKLRRIYGLGVVLEMACAEWCVPCLEVSHRTIKHRLTGDEYADKATVVRAVKALGVPLPSTVAEGQQDAADAVGAWLIGMNELDGGAASPWIARVGGLLI